MVMLIKSERYCNESCLPLPNPVTSNNDGYIAACNNAKNGIPIWDP